MSTFEKLFIGVIVTLGVLTVGFGGYFLTQSIFGRGSSSKSGDKAVSDRSGNTQKSPEAPSGKSGPKSISPGPAPDIKTPPQVPAPVLVPSRKAVLTGRIASAKDGRPLLSVSIEAYSQGGKSSARAFTQENGSFAFEDLAPGAYRLVISSASFETVMRDSVVVNPPETRDLGTIAMAETTGVEYLVVDTTGQFVESATVSVFFVTRRRPESQEKRQLVREEKTDALGRVILTGLADGVYRFKTSKAGFKDNERGPIRIIKGLASDKNIRSILEPAQ